ncbi:MAG: 50S ribosomal protein L25, partial [Planctomycetota bacterium]
MSDTVTLKASVREQAGTKATAKLRQQGLLPAVVYGHKQDPVSVSVESRTFINNLIHGNRIMDLDVNGKTDTIMVKAVQYDYLGKDIIHADLMRVNLSEKVKVQVQIELRGNAKGTHEGGIIEELMNTLEVECTVRDMPEKLIVNIKELELNATIHAGEIEMPDGITLITDSDAAVVACHEMAAAKSEDEEGVEGEEGAEGSAEPEVITEKKDEES